MFDFVIHYYRNYAVTLTMMFSPLKLEEVKRVLSTRYLIVLLMCANPVASAQPVEVVDFLGRTVSLAAPAERIIALAPHIVENVYAAGAGGQLVGVVSYSNFPEGAKSLPIVGGYKSFSLETILTLKPDLILMWASGNGMKALGQLEALNLPVYVDELSELEQIGRTIRDIGVLSGNQQAAEAQASSFLDGLAQLRKRHATAAPVSRSIKYGTSHCKP